jgi:hypothetical protein
MWRRVVWYKFTNMLEEHTIFRTISPWYFPFVWLTLQSKRWQQYSPVKQWWNIHQAVQHHMKEHNTLCSHHREEHRLRATENSAEGGIWTERWWSDRRMSWAGYVAWMVENRNAYRILVEMMEGKRPLGRPRRRWVNNSKNLRERGWGSFQYAIK